MGESVWLYGGVANLRDVVRELATSQHGFVATRQLVDLGVQKHVWERMITAGELERVTRRVVRVRGAPRVEEGTAMLAVLDAPEQAALSHTSAAALWGLPGFRLDRDLHVVVPARGAPVRRPTARVHFHDGLPQDHIVEYRGLRVTSPVLTMFHLAAVCHQDRVAVAFDRAWTDNLLSGASALRLLDRLAASGRNGISSMRAILEVRDPGYVPPASHLEHRFNALFGPRSGIPVLRRQVDIGGEHWVGRVDFVWDDIPGGVEVQSERFHTALVDRDRDALRAAKLEEAGLSLLAVWDSDVFHRPWLVVDQVRRFRWWLQGVIPDRPG